MNRRTAIKTIGLSASTLLADMALHPEERRPQEGKPPIGEQPDVEFPILMPDDLDEMDLVAWRVELAKPDPSNPLLESSMPWDAGGVMSHGTVLHDELDGLWKAWQVSTPAEVEINGLRSRHESERRITYLESHDGVHWTRPLFSSVPWPGYAKTNILLDADEEGSWQYASVLIHPDRKDWPYEMFALRNGRKEGRDHKVAGFPPPASNPRAHYRFRSTDGKSWQAIEGPLYIATDDVCFIYGEPGGGYSAYSKYYIPVPDGMRIIPYDNNQQHKLRVISRRTSMDGSNWSDGEIILVPDWRDPNHLQFVEFTQLPVKGGRIGIGSTYDAITMTICPQIYASRDGRSWWSPDRRTALPNASLGDYGGGLIWQMKDLLRIGDEVYMYYAGTQGTHVEIFDTRFTPRMSARGESVLIMPRGTLPFAAALCRASWKYGRMWALAPSAGGPTCGRAVTKPQDCAGRKLWINAVVRANGSLSVELLDANHAVISGFSQADCSPIPSDSPNTQVFWKGGDRAPDRAARLKFYLTRSFVYGFDWR